MLIIKDYCKRERKREKHDHKWSSDMTIMTADKSALGERLKHLHNVSLF